MLTRPTGYATEYVPTDEEREALALTMRSEGWQVLVRVMEARYWRYVARLADPTKYRYREMGHGQLVGRLQEIEYIVEQMQREIENNGTA